MKREPTAKEKILQFLATQDRPVALHEMYIPGVSQTSASARLRELAREGLVYSSPVEGARYTVWRNTFAMLPLVFVNHK